MSMYQSFKPHHGRHHNPYNNYHPYEEFHPFQQFGAHHGAGSAFPPFPAPMFPAMFPHHDFAAPRSAGHSASIDWHETHDAHVLTAKLPGYRKEEVKLELEEEERHVLHLSCEKKADKEEKSDGYYHSERSNGRFVQRLKLPENSTPENIHAGLENGVLTVTIPKKKKESKKKSSRLILIS
ncbi:18.5 kDa class I heat shock protein [Linum perenne]